MRIRSQRRRVFAVFALTFVLSLAPLASVNAAGLTRWGSDEQRSASSWAGIRISWLRELVVCLLEKAGVQIDPEGHS